MSNTRPRYQEILWSRDLLFIFARSHMILLEIIRDLKFVRAHRRSLPQNFPWDLGRDFDKGMYWFGRLPHQIFFFCPTFCPNEKKYRPLLSDLFFCPTKNLTAATPLTNNLFDPQPFIKNKYHVLYSSILSDWYRIFIILMLVLFNDNFFRSFCNFFFTFIEFYHGASKNKI